MEIFNKISISHLIWYLVPGLALAFIMLFPFVVISPPIAKAIFTNLGPIGLLLLSIIFGFGLDGLRLYRLRPHYLKMKTDFFGQLTASVGASGLDPYFVQSSIADLARQKDVTGIGIHHAIWIMHGHLAMLAFLESFFWILAAVYFYVFESGPYPVLVTTASWGKALVLYLGLACTFFLLGIRFHRISREDQSTTNTMFLNFAKQHAVEIKSILKI